MVADNLRQLSTKRPTSIRREDFDFRRTFPNLLLANTIYSPDPKHMKKFLLLFSAAFCFHFANAQALSVSITNVINVTCYSSCNGSAMATPSGGTGPYTYNWTPGGATTQTASGLCAGAHTVTVTDATLATATVTVMITQPALLTGTFSTTSASCSMSNGSISVITNGGTAPFAYSWMPGNNYTPFVSNVSSGTYTCTVTDANGCTWTGTVVLNNIPGPTASMSSTTNELCFGGCNGSAQASVSGGTVPYTYNWSPSSQSTINATNLCAGTYTCTVTDANGCVATTSCTITQPTQLLPSISSFIPAGCNNSDGSASATATGGVGAYTYLWTPSMITSSNAFNLANSVTHSVTVTDANSCTATTTVTIGDSCDYVWPGDANEDAVADNNDILAIGIANGATGTTRANASTNWIGQPSTNWGQTLLSGTDYKFVDCDGNGAIQPADTNAVIQNFGLSHNMRGGGIPVYDATLPDLKITMGQSVLAANSQGTLTVSLGTNSIPVSNFYGLAFTLNFDATQIDAASFRMNENGTWMGNPGNDMMGVVLNSGTGSGSVEIAMTRLDHINANGFGNIANVAFMSTNNLTGTGNFQNVNFTISNVTVISANETPQSVNTVNDSVTVEDPILLGINTNENNSVSVFPNPFDEHTTIILPFDISGKQNEIVITDLQGRIVRSEKVSSANYILQRGNLDEGIYFCTVKSEGKVVGVTKIMVK